LAEQKERKMKIKSFIRKISCAILGHKWGKSEYESKNPCEQKVLCNRCGEIQQRIEHAIRYTIFSEKLDDYYHMREGKCERCSYVEKIKESHKLRKIKEEIIDMEYEIIGPVNVDHREQLEWETLRIVERCEDCGYERIYEIKSEPGIVSY